MVEKTDAATASIEKASKPAGGKPVATRDEGNYMVPPVDIYETDKALSVIVDLPGVQKEDVNIHVDQNILTIRGAVNYEPPKGIIRGEFNLMNFFRQFQLSDEVDQTGITAEAKNGVLAITLPKAEKAKPRQIAVKVD